MAVRSLLVRDLFLFFPVPPKACAIAAKTADLILIMLDATKSEEHRRLLELELDAVGIRLNKTKPDVVFKKKTTGGVGNYYLPASFSQLLSEHSCRLPSTRQLS